MSYNNKKKKLIGIIICVVLLLSGVCIFISFPTHSSPSEEICYDAAPRIEESEFENIGSYTPQQLDIPQINSEEANPTLKNNDNYSEEPFDESCTTPPPASVSIYNEFGREVEEGVWIISNGQLKEKKILINQKKYSLTELDDNPVYQFKVDNTETDWYIKK